MPVNRVTFTVVAPQPFRLDLTALALVRRPNNRIDTWRDGVYRRVVPTADPYGPDRVAQFLLEVEEAKPGHDTGGASLGGAARFTELLQVTATGSLSEQALALAAERAVTHMFGLDVDMEPFLRVAHASAELSPLVRQLTGLRPPRYPGLYQALLNAVPCQQVTLVLGLRLIERMCREYGPDLPFAPLTAEAGPLPLPDAPALTRLSAGQLVELGFSNAKARTLLELAAALVSGEMSAAQLASAPNETVAAELQRLYGIGRWTAEYALLRGLGRLDVYPYGDSGARNSLARFMGQQGKPSYEWVAHTVAAWQPYAGFVYLHLLVAGMVQSGAFSSS